MKRIFSVFLVAILAICSSNIVHAEESTELVSRGNDFASLKSEVQYIDSLEIKNVKEFYKSNENYFKDLEHRLEKYASNNHITEQQAIDKIKSHSGTPLSLKDELLGTKMLRASSKSMSDYFKSYQYHYRGGYWTYSMAPKLSTRILRPVCSNAWSVLKQTYPKIKYNESSLSDQYWCHFEAFIESGWDIEEGCPDVGFARVVLSLCNPCQNAD
ncbi:MAG: DUF2599 domain-containing protein [Helcococcus sp.]|nr:DUF2599 domain-containing protein [Helcococcus sp.]